jgi:hypothetical protein
MRKIQLVLPFFLLFFFLFAMNARAYQIFNSNPNFETNTNSFVIAEQGSNGVNCLTPVYDNDTQTLVITSNGDCNSEDLDSEILYISPTNLNLPLQYGTNAQENNSIYHDYFTLPKNKEGIVSLKVNIFQTNGTYNFSSFNGDSFLLVQHSGTIGNYSFSETYNITSLIAGNGWNNITLIVPSDSIDRNISIYAFLHFGSTPPSNFLPNENFTVTLKQFQFYTLDVNELRTDWTNNFTYESLRYCGSGATLRTDDPGDSNYSNSFANDSYWFGTDVNGIDCGYVQLGNLIIARHWAYSTQANQWEYYTSNLFFVQQYADYVTMFVESFLRTQIKFTLLQNTMPSINASYIFYDDMAGNFIKMEDLRYNYTNAFRQTISLIDNADKVKFYNNISNPILPNPNQNPSGNNFRFWFNSYSGSYSPWHPFFTSNLQVDNMGWYCSDITNSEGYILGNGTEIKSQYCGDFGCNAQHTHCDFGFIGIYCSDSTHWAYSDVYGVQDAGTCTALCKNVTGGIICSHLNNTHECINNNGEVVDCNVLVPLPTIATNPLGTLALIIGGLFGITDLATSEFISSIIFSLIFALILPTAIIIYLSKKLEAGTEKIFAISWIAWLIVFVKIGWFDPFIWTLLIIGDVVLVTGLASKLIHGGG